MEAYGFFQTASIFFKKDKIMVLKIVSDILENKAEDRILVDFKDENLFTESYNNIYKFLVNFKTVNDDSDFTIIEQELIKKVLENLRLSDTMTYELFNILRYLKIKYGNIDILKKYENIEVTSKVQAKKLFEEIKNISLQKNSLEKKVSPETNKRKFL